MPKDTIGSRIRDAREQKGISASDLARAVNVTATAVWNWEKNGRRPHHETLSSVAQVLGVTIDFLLSGETPAEKNGRSLTVADVTEEARAKIAKMTGFAIERVKVHVEFATD